MSTWTYHCVGGPLNGKTNTITFIGRSLTWPEAHEHEGTYVLRECDGLTAYYHWERAA